MHFTLKFQLHSFWRAGTGMARGQAEQELCHRDHYGLPELPGKTVKGLLRDAVNRMEDWGHIAPIEKNKSITDTWFGTRTEEGIDDATQSGILRVGSASLEPRFRKELIDLYYHDKAYLDTLFDAIHATAIEKGTAKNTSLRMMEVVVPIPLYAEITVLDDSRFSIKDFSSSLCLLRSLGSQRTRGLGRVTVKVVESMEEASDAA